jgi:tRNA dimethylallyltransferase
VGKTAAAIALARRLGTAIVSADSRQCYEGMTIGTAKPDAGELAAVPHYFINCFPPTTSLSAADYEKLALGYLQDIFTTHDTAVVCGGTGLYIKALCEGLDEMPDTNPDINAQIETTYKEQGIIWLQQAIAAEDPEFYKTGEIHNPARMLRALAFVRTTGTSITQYRTRQPKVRPFSIVKVALDLPREVLYTRINKRVDIMLSQGLVAEVQALIPYRHLKNLQTVGYAEIFDYLDGNCTVQDATEKIKQHSRNYAKRQITWFKKDTQFNWLSANDPELIEKIVQLPLA